MSLQDEQKAKDPSLEYDEETIHTESSASVPYFEPDGVKATERLSAKEEAARRLEENVNASSKYQFDHQDEVTKLRFGRILHMDEFIRLLRKVRPDAQLNEFSKLGRIGVRCGTKFVTTIHFGYSPEYSTLRTGQYGEATNEAYRGWRTALLHLITGGYITQQQADKAFGPATGPESGPYLRQLQAYRNSRMIA